MDSPASLFDLKESRWRSPEVEAALKSLSISDASHRGAIFTRIEVVDFILDLVGYKVGSGLAEKSLLEPSCGAGDFLLAAVRRLLEDSVRSAKDRKGAVARLSTSIRAVELHTATATGTRQKLSLLLQEFGISVRDAELLVAKWIVTDDFLLSDLPAAFDCVIGNPPYVRQELIPAALLRKYRSRYCTLSRRRQSRP